MTKASLYTRAQALLRNTPVGGAIVGDDRDWLLALLEQHPRAEMKIGPGVGELYVDLAPGGGNKGFWIRRTDGSETDFSYRKAISPPTPDQDARAAMRSEVVYWVEFLRALYFMNRQTRECPITGEIITAQSCHVDHAAPLTFKVLADEFAEGEGGYGRIEIGHVDRQKTYMANTTQRDAWRHFHASRSRLRVVSPHANLSVLRRKR